MLDTRNGTGETAGALGKGGIAAFGTGVVAIPASAMNIGLVSGVVVNVTVTQPQEGGYLTLYPHYGTPSNTSTLNFSPGQTIANAATVKLIEDGVEVYNGSPGNAQLVMDVFGYYS